MAVVCAAVGTEDAPNRDVDALGGVNLSTCISGCVENLSLEGSLGANGFCDPPGDADDGLPAEDTGEGEGALDFCVTFVCMGRGGGGIEENVSIGVDPASLSSSSTSSTVTFGVVMPLAWPEWPFCFLEDGSSSLASGVDVRGGASRIRFEPLSDGRGFDSGGGLSMRGLRRTGAEGVGVERKPLLSLPLVFPFTELETDLSIPAGALARLLPYNEG